MLASDVMEARNIYSEKRYGINADALDAEVDLALRFNGGCPAKTAQSILSDAQEILAFGDKNAANVKINLAQYVISKYLKTEGGNNEYQ